MSPEWTSTGPMDHRCGPSYTKHGRQMDATLCTLVPPNILYTSQDSECIRGPGTTCRRSPSSFPRVPGFLLSYRNPPGASEAKLPRTRPEESGTDSWSIRRLGLWCNVSPPSTWTIPPLGDIISDLNWVDRCLVLDLICAVPLGLLVPSLLHIFCFTSVSNECFPGVDLVGITITNFADIFVQSSPCNHWLKPCHSRFPG